MKASHSRGNCIESKQQSDLSTKNKILAATPSSSRHHKNNNDNDNDHSSKSSIYSTSIKYTFETSVHDTSSSSYKNKQIYSGKYNIYSDKTTTDTNMSSSSSPVSPHSNKTAHNYDLILNTLLTFITYTYTKSSKGYEQGIIAYLEYCDLKTLMNLDTAITNHYLRPHWLRLLSNVTVANDVCSSTSTGGSTGNRLGTGLGQLTDSKLQWILLKKLNVDNLISLKIPLLHMILPYNTLSEVGLVKLLLPVCTHLESINFSKIGSGGATNSNNNSTTTTNSTSIVSEASMFILTKMCPNLISIECLPVYAFTDHTLTSLAQ